MVPQGAADMDDRDGFARASRLRGRLLFILVLTIASWTALAGLLFLLW
jgi:hypothetical protein